MIIPISEKRLVPIGSCSPWSKNPKAVKKSDYDRCKRQILDLGLYKPLIACPPDKSEPGDWIILGGNTRLAILEDLNQDEVEISIVYPKNEAERLKYALSDNDIVGEIIEEKLAELAYINREKINLADFKINLAPPVSLETITLNLTPEAKDAAADLDEELAGSAGLMEAEIKIIVPKENEAEIREWLANGERGTAPGLGKGVMKRCGLL